MEDAINSQPEQGDAVTVIVFEKRPRWGPQLERQFANENVRVIECRSIPDVAERSADIVRGAIVLDLAAQAAECLRFLGRRLGDGAPLPVFVVGSDWTADLEWPVRDLGATAFFPKTIPSHEMAELCRRQWAGETQSENSKAVEHD